MDLADPMLAVVTDDELAAEALAADPDPALGEDAVALPSSGQLGQGLLPEWYMPAGASRVRGRARRWVLGGIVVGLLVINGLGLCVTYGIVEIAW